METEILVNGEASGEEISKLRESVGWRPLKEKFNKVIKSSYMTLSIRNENGELIAFLRVISDGEIHAYIADFVVHPQHQNKGIGSKLLEKAIKLLQEKEIEFIELTFKDDNLNFYERAGFEINLSGQIRK